MGQNVPQLEKAIWGNSEGCSFYSFRKLFSKAEGYAEVKETVNRLMGVCALTSMSQ